jgi:hypothetical protein
MSSEQAKSRYRGRNAEYRLAKLVHGVVVGRSKAVVVNGKTIVVNPCAPPDVVTTMFSFESKWLKSLPVSVTKAVLQSKTNCPEGLIPITVMCDRTTHDKLFIMREQDFLDLHIGE